MADRDGWVSCEIENQLKNRGAHSMCSDLAYQEAPCCLSMVELREDGCWVGRKDARGAVWSRAGWDWIVFF